MPVIRKVMVLGNSRVVSIPKGWLEFYERETGQQIREVTVEVNRVLKIQPVISKESDKK